jgi:hypothetical protein
LIIQYKRETCRACNSSKLRRFLNLGPTPLANAFLKSPQEFDEENSYPLDVYYCENCSLVQLLDVINPEILFRDYIYVTGTSDTIAAHNLNYAQTVVGLLNMSSKDLVVEVASNDGSLLKCFQPYQVRTLGIEPATNIAKMANDSGVETINQFFDSETARCVRETYGPAKAVIGNNVLAHVDEAQDFLLGCRSLLSADGLVIIEVPYLKELLDRLEYDTIYHEHLCYFSVSTLIHLCDAVGLSMVRVDQVSVHGGSLRMYAGLPDHYGGHAPEVLRMVAGEEKEGLNNFSRYEQFALQVEENRRSILSMLTSLKSQGKTVAGYGAPAKGNTLLNYCGISTDLLPFTVDKNPLKVHTYTPGMHIPVFPVTRLLEDQPDYVFILAWNFAGEIVRQQSEYLEKGGKFIVPIPMPEVIT